MKDKESLFSSHSHFFSFRPTFAAPDQKQVWEQTVARLGKNRTTVAAKRPG